MSFKKVFEGEHFKGIERSCEIRHNRWQIIHDNMTPGQYYKGDKQDLYNMINFDKLYIIKKYEGNINNLFDKLYGRLLKGGVIKEPDSWEEREKTEKVQAKVFKIFSGKKSKKL